jgi:hypothetical protein
VLVPIRPAGPSAASTGSYDMAAEVAATAHNLVPPAHHLMPPSNSHNNSQFGLAVVATRRSCHTTSPGLEGDGCMCLCRHRRSIWCQQWARRRLVVAASRQPRWRSYCPAAQGRPSHSASQDGRCHNAAHLGVWWPASGRLVVCTTRCRIGRAQRGREV